MKRVRVVFVACVAALGASAASAQDGGALYASAPARQRPAILRGTQPTRRSAAIQATKRATRTRPCWPSGVRD